MASTGLSSREAEHFLRAIGQNEVRQRGRVSVWSSIGVQLRDPLIGVPLAACVLTLATRDLTDGAVIGVVVLVNTTIGVVEEIRADHATTALAQLDAPSARVLHGVEPAVPAVIGWFGVQLTGHRRAHG